MSHDDARRIRDMYRWAFTFVVGLCFEFHVGLHMVVVMGQGLRYFVGVVQLSNVCTGGGSFRCHECSQLLSAKHKIKV